VLPAQESAQSASIVLEVKDASGAVVPNALVLICPSSNTLGNNLMTNREGKLSLDLPPGIYDICVWYLGFRLARRHNEVQRGTHQTISIALQVGGCTECLAVTAAASPANPFYYFPEAFDGISPDGRYVIAGLNCDSEPHHTLYWEDRALKTWRKWLTYDTRVVLLWSPDSELLAVTDYVSSNRSRCSVYSVDETIPPIQVLDLLFSRLSKSEQTRLKRFLSNQQAYVEASAWNGPAQLAVGIHGSGDANPAGFSELYELQLHPRQP
jgi:hypothetical protein